MVPWHPVSKSGRDLACMPLNRGQILEWSATVQLADVDEAQIQVAHRRAMRSLEGHGIPATQDRLLQGQLVDIVVKRRTSDTQEQRQLRSMRAEGVDRRSEVGVRLHQLRSLWRFSHPRRLSIVGPTDEATEHSATLPRIQERSTPPSVTIFDRPAPPFSTAVNTPGRTQPIAHGRPTDVAGTTMKGPAHRRSNVYSPMS